jgi:hypothetical protein
LKLGAGGALKLGIGGGCVAQLGVGGALKLGIGGGCVAQLGVCGGCVAQLGVCGGCAQLGVCGGCVAQLGTGGACGGVKLGAVGGLKLGAAGGVRPLGAGDALGAALVAGAAGCDSLAGAGFVASVDDGAGWAAATGLVYVGAASAGVPPAGCELMTGVAPWFVAACSGLFAAAGGLDVIVGVGAVLLLLGPAGGDAGDGEPGSDDPDEHAASACIAAAVESA